VILTAGVGNASRRVLSSVIFLDNEEKTVGKLVLPSLVLSISATQPSVFIAMLLLIDIGLSFNTPVGITGQITTSAYVLGVVMAILMSVLSVRFKHKSLLVAGLALYSVSALGCFSAFSFSMMLVAFALTGIGSALVGPMRSTLAADLYAFDQRPRVIGWTVAGGSVAALIGSPLVSYLASVGGWRLPFIALMFPISLVALVLAYVGIPFGSTKEELKVKYLDGFKSIFSNKSAVTCLVGTALAAAAWNGSLTYSMSFYRQQFGLETTWVSLLLSVMALSYTVGAVWSGPLVNRFGRKRFTEYSVLFLALTTIAYLNIGQLWFSSPVACVSCIVAGFTDSSLVSLNLEQTPDNRGSMMSLSQATYMLGSTMGTGLGGLILLMFTYRAVGLAYGVLGLLASALYYLFSREPST